MLKTARWFFQMRNPPAGYRHTLSGCSRSFGYQILFTSEKMPGEEDTYIARWLFAPILEMRFDHADEAITAYQNGPLWKDGPAIARALSARAKAAMGPAQSTQETKALSE